MSHLYLFTANFIMSCSAILGLWQLLDYENDDPLVEWDLSCKRCKNVEQEKIFSIICVTDVFLRYVKAGKENTWISLF